METLDLKFSRDNGAAIVTMIGQVDGNSSDRFAQFQLVNILETDKVVILDLTRLDFISSAGLRQFMKLAKRLNKMGVKATLAGATPIIAQTFEIAGFNTLFHRCPSLVSALCPVAIEGRKSLFSPYFTGKKR